MFFSLRGLVYYFNGCFFTINSLLFYLPLSLFFFGASCCGCCWNTEGLVKLGSRKGVCVSGCVFVCVCVREIVGLWTHFVIVLWLQYFVLSQILWIAWLIFPFIPYAAFTNRPCHILFISSQSFIYSTCPLFFYRILSHFSQILLEPIWPLPSTTLCTSPPVKTGGCPSEPMWEYSRRSSRGFTASEWARSSLCSQISQDEKETYTYIKDKG